MFFYYLTDSTFWVFFEQFGVVFSALLICMFIFEYDPDKRKYIIWLVVSLAASYILVWILQHSVGRIRPSRCGYEMTFVPFLSGWEQDHSVCFPSGHTTFAFVFATFLAGLYPRMHWLFYAIATLTGLSRVVHEAHWISDVYGGMLTGYGLTSLIKTHCFSIEKSIRKRLPAVIQKRLWPDERTGLKKGDKCPVFSAVTIQGKTVSPHRAGRANYRLVFVPSVKAPAIIDKLRQFDTALKDSNDNYTTIIITPDAEHFQSEIKKRHNLSMDFISDRKRKISRSFNLLAIGRRRPRETTVNINNKGLIEEIQPAIASASISLLLSSSICSLALCG